MTDYSARSKKVVDRYEEIVDIQPEAVQDGQLLDRLWALTGITRLEAKIYVGELLNSHWGMTEAASEFVRKCRRLAKDLKGLPEGQLKTIYDEVLKEDPQGIVDVVRRKASYLFQKVSGNM